MMTKKIKNDDLSQFVCTYQDHKKVSVTAKNANIAAALARKKRKELFGDNRNIVLLVTQV